MHNTRELAHFDAHPLKIGVQSWGHPVLWMCLCLEDWPLNFSSYRQPHPHLKRSEIGVLDTEYLFPAITILWVIPRQTQEYSIEMCRKFVHFTSKLLENSIAVCTFNWVTAQHGLNETWVLLTWVYNIMVNLMCCLDQTTITIQNLLYYIEARRILYPSLQCAVTQLKIYWWRYSPAHII